MRKKLLWISFLAMLALLIIALGLTVFGSMLDNDTVLQVGIIAWLVTSGLFFVWLVLLVSTRLKRYGRGKP
jgi:hypothetical protein